MALSFLLIYPLIFGNDYFIHVAIIASVYAINAVAWSLLSATTGQLNLAPALFLGIGGYASVFLSKWFNLSPWLCLPLSGCIVAFFGTITCISSLRLKGPYLGIVTLAFVETVRLLVISFSGITGGEEGISGVLPLFENVFLNYYFSLALMIFTAIFLLRIVNSRIGIGFRSIAGDEMVAEGLGVNSVKIKLMAFITSAFFGGLSGSFLAHYMAHIEPAVFEIEHNFLIIFMAVIGGSGTIAGPIIGAYVLQFSSEYFRVVFPSIVYLRHFAYSLLLILTMYFAHGGLMNLIRKAFKS
jgi:branched-chain amino acid transport system permease protein